MGDDVANKDDGRADRIEQELRRWGQRLPRTTPAAAAAQVRARIQRARRSAPWGRLWPLGATAAVVVALAGLWLTTRPPALTPGSSPGLHTEAPPPLPPNVVQWWLDQETPVYFVMGPERTQ